MNSSFTDPGLRYEPQSETYHAQHDWEGDRQLSGTIIAAVAAVTETPLDELEPFCWTLDADAMDSLYEPQQAAGRPGTGFLSFTYGGCSIVVFWDGHIIVNPNEGASID